MTGAVTLVRRCETLGIQLTANGGRVHYVALSDVMTQNLMDRIRAHKPELLNVLSKRVAWRIFVDGQQVTTLMHPGGMTEAEALHDARQHWPAATVRETTGK